MGRRGRVESRPVTELAVYHAVAFADRLGPYRADLPAALQSLARGDAAPLLHLSAARLAQAIAELRRGRLQLLALPRHALPGGGLPWTPDSALETRDDADDAYLRRLGPGPFAPFSAAIVRTSGAARPCSVWPATPAPEPPPATIPDVPVLVLSGRLDLVTSLETARLIAAAHPRATLIQVPHAGHSLVGSSDCARTAATTFLAGGAPPPCGAAPPERVASPYTRRGCGARGPSHRRRSTASAATSKPRASSRAPATSCPACAAASRGSGAAASTCAASSGSAACASADG